ncbi:AAA family ATPase, partial [Pseudomonas aeruginosa]|uniref:AAA family ATPase n=1 Tax=Pseudomonas aeruginosa TaxID=287 RepID=UPI0039692AB3
EIRPTQRNDAHRLIEECMLCANVATARFLQKHAIPALYRVHDGPPQEKLNNLRQFLGELGLSLGRGKAAPTPGDYQELLEKIHDRADFRLIQTVMLRSLSQAVYSPDNNGHFGLNYDAYTHFTSPIRRYPDLLVHRAIRSVIRSKAETPHVQRAGAASMPKARIYPYDELRLDQLGEQCSMTERRADEATRDVTNWLKCEYMRERVGETFPGVITAVTGFGLFVELTDIFVEGLVHVTALPGDYYHFDAVHHRLSGERTGRSFRLGDTTEVVVARVDLDERKIDFELAGNVLSAPIGRKKRNGDKSANAGKAPKGRKGASVPEVDLEPALASPDAAVVPRRKAGKVQALPPVAPELLAQAAEMLGNTDVRKSREVKQALLAQAESERHVQEDQWSRQRELAERLLALRQQLARAREANREEQGGEANAETFPADEHGGVEALEKALHETRQALADAQAQGRLVSFEVCPRLVAEVIGAWTGVPVEQLAREHNAKVMGFADDLRARIRGQEQAVSALDRAMRATAAGLNKPDAPVGVFLLVGPSGVGKTETALALADLLYGGERFITTINMSEFQEKHTVSRLIGAPPGYVGYGEGGMLTEAVRQKPYSVILLDEVEKADPDVLNLFYQIFDKGVANDGEGREIDFRNTLILMTSNLASEHIAALCQDGARPSAELLEETIRPALSRHFKPALLARMRVVPYYPVGGPVLRELIEIKLQRLGERLARRQLAFDYSQALVGHLAERCTQSDSGARLIDHLLDTHLLPLVADRLLEAMARDERLERVHATLGEHGRVLCEFA